MGSWHAVLMSWIPYTDKNILVIDSNPPQQNFYHSKQLQTQTKSNVMRSSLFFIFLMIIFLLAAILISLDMFFIMCNEKEKDKRNTMENREMIVIRSGKELHDKEYFLFEDFG